MSTINLSNTFNVSSFNGYIFPEGIFQTSRNASPTFLLAEPLNESTVLWTILAIVLTKIIISS